MGPSNNGHTFGLSIGFIPANFIFHFLNVHQSCTTSLHCTALHTPSLRLLINILSNCNTYLSIHIKLFLVQKITYFNFSESHSLQVTVKVSAKLKAKMNSDILNIVFSYLDPPDIKNVSQVSR